MKSNNNWAHCLLSFLIYINAFVSFGQDKICDFEQVIEETIIEQVEQEKYEGYVRLIDVLSFKPNEFLGSIGTEKKRLHIAFDQFKIDVDNPNCYLVSGFTTVQGKNKRNFSGSFLVEGHFSLRDTFYDSSKQFGYSLLSFEADENSALEATGRFKGKVIVLWSRGADEKMEYDDIFEGYDGSRNYQCIGSWTSYKTQNTVPVAWGQWRIPCAGDLDIGAAEFSPNPKYFSEGWNTYTP